MINELKKKGITLSGNEMKKIRGGNVPLDGGCILTMTGGSQPGRWGYIGHGTCSQQSSGANNACVELIMTFGGSCRYDCACDGYGV